MTQQAKSQTAAQMMAEHARWFGKYADASIAIAKYIADQPTTDPVLAELIQKWKAIKQENKGSDRNGPQS